MFKRFSIICCFLAVGLFITAAAPAPVKPENKTENTPLALFKGMRDALNQKAQNGTINKGEQRLLNKLDKKVTKWETKNAKRIADGKAPKAGKNWIAALLLCLFLGGLSIHRFYLGYTWQGIVQILTLGGLGIWLLIDLIRIITKSLKPKGGDYEN